MLSIYNMSNIVSRKKWRSFLICSLFDEEETPFNPYTKRIAGNLSKTSSLGQSLFLRRLRGQTIAAGWVTPWFL